MSPTFAVKQLIPYTLLLVSIYLALASLKLSIGFIPELSAKIKGIYSKASANPLIAYYSTPANVSAIYLK